MIFIGICAFGGNMARTKVINLMGGGVLLYNNDKHNNYSNLKIGFLVGHRHNTKNGLAHFCEHMLFNGTGTRSKTEFLTDQQNVCYLNATTGFRFTVVTFNRTNRLIEESFAHASDMLLNPSLNNDAIKNEKGIIENEYVRAVDRDLRDPAAQFMFSFTDAPKLRNRLGNKADLQKIRREDIVNFRQKYYHSNNFIAVYVGNLSARRVKSLLAKYFISKLSYSEDVEVTKTPVDAKTTREAGLAVSNVNLDPARVMIAFPYQADFSSNKVRVLNQFIEMFINKNARQFFYALREKGLVYEASADCTGGFNQRYLSYFFVTKNEQIDECLQVLGETIRGLVEKKISNKDFDSIKNNMIYTREQQFLPSKREISDYVFEQFLDTGKVLNLSKREYLKIVQNMKIEDVFDYIDTIFRNNSLPYCVIIGNEKAKKITYVDIIKRVYPNVIDILTDGNKKKIIIKNSAKD